MKGMAMRKVVLFLTGTLVGVAIKTGYQFMIYTPSDIPISVVEVRNPMCIDVPPFDNRMFYSVKCGTRQVAVIAMKDKNVQEMAIARDTANANVLIVSSYDGVFPAKLALVSRNTEDRTDERSVTVEDNDFDGIPDVKLESTPAFFTKFAVDNVTWKPISKTPRPQQTGGNK